MLDKENSSSKATMQRLEELQNTVQHFAASRARIEAIRRMADADIKLFQAKKYEDWYKCVCEEPTDSATADSGVAYMSNNNASLQTLEARLINEAASQEETSQILYDLAVYAGKNAQQQLRLNLWTASKATSLLRSQPTALSSTAMPTLKTCQLLSQ